ncbi:hypothetical protein HX779_09135 [Pseudomonas sp. A4002]|nr:hypothetical protein [Pseudomonas sp. A4002]NWB81088.1 hypothetical protein [Pseudomonas sp. F9001]
MAWGDTEGEKDANTNAQKAAKNLTTATEQNRRQHLIITALKKELVTVDQHIDEAQKKYNAIERTAMFLARTVLEEQWNEKAQVLMDLGSKLWAVEGMLGGDQLSLRKWCFQNRVMASTNGADVNGRSFQANTPCRTSYRCNAGSLKPVRIEVMITRIQSSAGWT